MIRVKLLSARQLVKIGVPVEWTEIDNIQSIASQIWRGRVDLISVLRTMILACVTRWCSEITHIVAKQNLRTVCDLILVAADHSTFAWTTWHDKAGVQIDQVGGTVLDVGCAGKTPRRLPANGNAKRRLDLNTESLSE
jgi:hypothetical protein